MNSKRRCTFCRSYYDSDSADATSVGLSGVCSTECLNDLKNKARKKRARRAEHRANRIRFGHRLAGDIRGAVRKRDNYRCRYCGSGSARLEVHHVKYRSEGGKDEVDNLMLLCSDHHRLMHTSKRKWQPILQLMLWQFYTEGKMPMVPGAEKALTPLLERLSLSGDWTDADE